MATWRSLSGPRSRHRLKARELRRAATASRVAAVGIAPARLGSRRSTAVSTMISSAYKLCRDIIRADYPPGSWNIYPFHFSDGDNWSADDTRHCVEMLKTDVLPHVNQFAYGQVESPYGSGQFIKDLRETVGPGENVSLSEIADKDAISHRGWALRRIEGLGATGHH